MLAHIIAIHESNKAKKATSPLQVYQYAEFLNSRLIFTLGDEPKELPTHYSLFEIKGDLTLSIVKKAENRPGYIIRLLRNTAV